MSLRKSSYWIEECPLTYPIRVVTGSGAVGCSSLSVRTLPFFFPFSFYFRVFVLFVFCFPAVFCFCFLLFPVPPTKAGLPVPSGNTLLFFSLRSQPQTNHSILLLTLLRHRQRFSVDFETQPQDRWTNFLFLFDPVLISSLWQLVRILLKSSSWKAFHS